MKVDLTPRASHAQTQILSLLHQAWRMNPHPQEQIFLEYLLMSILIQVLQSFVLSHAYINTGTVDSAYLQSLFVRENFAIKRTLR